MLGALSGPIRPAARAPAVPTEVVLVLDEPQRRRCGRRRFRSRTVRFLDIGELRVRYESGEAGPRHLHPAQLLAAAPPGMGFGYDVMAEVLRLRYTELKQRKQIRTDLAARKVAASAGSVTRLSRLALGCLEQLHEAAARALGDFYRRQAFILHLDGTHEGGQWCHFVIRDGMTGHVLLARKIRSEHSDDIARMLRRVRELFGLPDAVISDMSEAIRKAVAEVFPDTPHRLCHFHFLKAVGKVIPGPDHDTLGNSVRHIRGELLELRRDGVQRLRDGDRLQGQVIALIDRITVYTGDLSGEGFPFDLPNLCFLRRCRDVGSCVQALLRSAGRGELAGGRELAARLVRLRQLLRFHAGEGRRPPVIARLERREELFAQFRDILHPVVENTRAPLNWGRLDDPARIADIGAKLSALRETARRKARRRTLTPSDRRMWKSLHRQLEAHADMLVPVLEIRGRTFVLPRTNNLSEIGFRNMKRRQRRTTGNRNLKRQLDRTPPQVFYVENLDCPDYRRLVLDNRPLHECFADTDWEKVRKTADTMITPFRAGAVDRELIARDDFFDTVAASLSRPRLPAD